VLQQYVFINATAKAFEQLYTERRSGLPCIKYFPKDWASKICGDSHASLDRYSGILLWVIAYYRHFQPVNDEFNSFLFIFERLNVTDPTIRNQILNEGLLSQTFAEIQKDFADALECFTAPCDKKYLAERQYYQSAVTNLTLSKYKSLKVDE
jgi:hypothetical protein